MCGGWRLKIHLQKILRRLGIRRLMTQPANGCLPIKSSLRGEETDGGGEQIKGAKTEDSTIKEGTVTYDIRFYAVAPQTGEMIRLIINVEAQNDFYPGYPIIKRGIYYCSRMVSSQYGVEFTGSHFEKIKKVYSIWVCANPPQYRENTVTRYTIQEENLIGEVKEKNPTMTCLQRS